MSRRPPTAGRSITVAMIVRDAAPLLPQSLATAQAIGDEIVVYDTGSTDGTHQIVRHAGATLIERPWHDDFSAARNACLAHCHGDWVLWLDAGETISPADAAAIQKFVHRDANRNRAYVLLVQLAPATPAGLTEQVGRIRLVPRLPQLHFSGRVRERIAPSLEAAGLTVEGLPWRIHRDPSDHDPARRIAKAKRDLRLADLELSERPATPQALNARGDALTALGSHPSAADSFREALSLATPGSVDQLESFYGLLTVLDATPTATDPLDACLAALEAFPLDAQLLCMMGKQLQEQGRLDLAARAFEVAHRHGRIHPQVWHLAEIHETAAVCESIAWELAGQDDSSAAGLTAALATRPESARLWRRLVKLHIKHGRRDEALAALAHWPMPATGRTLLRSAVRGACLLATQNWLPALPYLRTAYDAGCRDPICMAAMIRALAATNDRNGAETIAREWATLDPADAEARQILKGLVPPSRLETPRPARTVRVDPATAGQATFASATHEEIASALWATR